MPKKMRRTSRSDVLMEELSAIQGAYGNSSVDLYTDVLEVSPSADPGQVQKAFFQQRQSLFKILAQNNQANRMDEAAEKQMDALVLTYRILGDAVMRGEYDEFRAGSKRSKRQVTPEKEERQSKSTKKSHGSSRRYVMEEPQESPNLKSSRKSSFTSIESRLVSDTEETAGDTVFTAGDTTVGETVFSESTAFTISKRNGRESFLQRATEEIEGCIEDTMSAFDQVFNVFTLNDQDIRAVTGRIQKAKRELTL